MTLCVSLSLCVCVSLCAPHLCAGISGRVSLITRGAGGGAGAGGGGGAGGQVLHQHGGEHAHHAVQLALPEAVVLACLPAQDADDGALGEGELVLRLTSVVVQGLGERH